MMEHNSTTYTHWHLQSDEDNIAWLSFDRADKPVNALNAAALLELEQILDTLKLNRPQGLVIQSGKKNGFIAGADIEEFTQFNNAQSATEVIQKGQNILNKLAQLSMPTLAWIEGFCLGGGLELALACRYRISDDTPKIRLGLPEVMLGIHPGWGGTIRLPQLIGPLKAMDLILSGRTIGAKEARRIKLLDAVVPKRHQKAAIKHYILKQPKLQKAPVFNKIGQVGFVRTLLGRLLRRKVMRKARPEHYPAPHAVIDNWINYDIYEADAYRREAESIGQLITTDTARNLVRVFFLQEHLKGLSKNLSYDPNHVHVIGAGTMGGDIAIWCALKGFTVTLQDASIVAIGKTMKRAQKLFRKKLKDPYLVQKACDRLIPDIDGLGGSIADIILEAIVEDLSVKQGLFQKLEQQSKPTAILATNTSTIPLAEIAEPLQHPERLIGIHFFNPVAQMQLVEIVKDTQTSLTTEQNAIVFARRLDKLPLPVRSAPGFLVNRILMPYLLESITLLEEGIEPLAIDQAALQFGMPMGPIELADTVGLDVCQNAAEKLLQHFGGDLPKRIRDMVQKGKLGKKTGEGFYKYRKGKAIKPKLSPQYQAPEDLLDRLILRMLNELVACLREGIVESTDLLDAGIIFGTGFAPFRGGPSHYIQTIGPQSLQNKLEKLANRYGERFKPDKGWQNFATGS